MWPFAKKQSGPQQALLLRIQAVEEALLALQAAHERLRGRFYALKGPAEPGERPLSKAEILARWNAAKRGS